MLGFSLLLSRMSSCSSEMVGRWKGEARTLTLFELLWMPSTPLSDLWKSSSPLSNLPEDVRSEITPPDLIHSLISPSFSLHCCCPLISMNIQPCIFFV